MASLPPSILSVCNSSIKVLTCGGILQSRNGEHALYKSFPTPLDDDDYREGNTIIYFIASLAKVFIAFGLCKIIDILSKDENSRYKLLHGAWNRSFVEVFNYIRQGNGREQMDALYGDPTIRQLLVHHTGIYSMDHALLAPDGTPLLSAQEFLEYTPHYTKSTKHMANEMEYSNANYALLGLLIEAVSAKHLGQFLKDEVFDPLGMRYTYTSAAGLEQCPLKFRTGPYHVLNESDRCSIDFSGPTDTIELALFCAYSCNADLDTLEWAILSGLNGKPVSPWLNEKFLRVFFQGLSSLDEDGNGYAPYGLYAALDTTWPGSHSLNRFLSHRLPYESKSSALMMGRSSGGENFRLLPGWFRYRVGLFILSCTDSRALRYRPRKYIWTARRIRSYL